MAKKKLIHCPKCSSNVATWDGKSTMNVVATCNYCRKRIVYHVDTKQIEIKNIPPRSTSSGMRFY